MDSNFQYQGQVTLKFYDKNGNLKSALTKHNEGTPYFFWVIQKILDVNNMGDIKPGKLMLTDEACNNELSSPIIRTSAYTIDEQIIYDSTGTRIEATNPCLRFEFNMSYYNLSTTQGIGNLTDYRLWLLGLDATGLNLPTIPEGQDFYEGVLSKITYESVKTGANPYSPVCAQVQIPEGSDTNYSLNEGEYITVLWDIYFSNNNNSNGGN